MFFSLMFAIIVSSGLIGYIYMEADNFSKTRKLVLSALWVFLGVCTALVCSNRAVLSLVFNAHAPNIEFMQTINLEYLGRVFLANIIYILLAIGVYFLITRKFKVSPVWFLVFLLIFNLAVYYPGTDSADGMGAYKQYLSHTYTDFQPPIFTLWWNIFHFYGATFIVNLLSYYGGLIYISYYLSRNGKKWQNDFLVLFCYNPLLFTQLNLIWHDISFAGFLLDCIAIYLAIDGIKNKKIITSLWIIYFTCLFLAIGFRLNGVLAAYPFIIMALYKIFKNRMNKKTRFMVSATVAAIISVIFVSFNSLITYKIYKAENYHMFTAVMLLDLAYIECETNHEFQIDPIYFSYQGGDAHARLCNEAINYYNSDGFYGNWAGGGQVLVIPPERHDPEFNNNLKSQWLHAIEKYPFAYLKYRAKTLTNILFFSYWYPPGNSSSIQETLYKISMYQHYDMKNELNIFMISATFACLFLCIYFRIFGLPLCILTSHIIQMIGWFFLIPQQPARYLLWDYLAVMLTICFLTLNRVKLKQAAKLKLKS